MLFKFPRLLVVITLVVLIMTACTPVATSQAVQLPEEIKIAIGTALLALLTAGFVYLFEKSGLDLRGFAVPISVVVSAFMIAQLQGWINTIPAQYDVTLTILLKILVILIGGFGILRLRANQPARLL